MNGTDDDRSTMPEGPEISRSGEVLATFLDEMQTWQTAWSEAPRDDHAAGQSAQLDAVLGQLGAVIQFFGSLSDKLPKGSDEELRIFDLTQPLLALGNQLEDLRCGKIGPLLERVRDGKTHVLTDVERRERTIVAAAIEVFMQGGVDSEEAGAVGEQAAKRIATILKKAGRAPNSSPKLLGANPSDKPPAWKVVLRWRYEVQAREHKDRNAADVQLFRRLVGDAALLQVPAENWRAAMREYAEGLLASVEY